MNIKSFAHEVQDHADYEERKRHRLGIRDAYMGLKDAVTRSWWCERRRFYEL